MYIRIDPDEPERDKISEGVEAIKNGRVLIYPTDTVYGIGCDIHALESVKKIFKIKRRSFKNPLSVAFSDLDMVRRFTGLNERQERFIKGHVEEPYTFILPKTPKIPDIVSAGLNTVGVRIPNHLITRKLIKLSDTPIITTSANISGEKAPVSVTGINDEIKDKVDMIIDSGACRLGVPSRIVDLTGEMYKVLRK